MHRAGCHAMQVFATQDGHSTPVTPPAGAVTLLPGNQELDLRGGGR